MPGHCSLCSHPDGRLIAADLVAGISYRVIEKRYNVTGRRQVKSRTRRTKTRHRVSCSTSRGGCRIRALSDSRARYCRHVRGAQGRQGAGRPKRVFSRDAVVDLRGQGMSIGEISKRLGIGAGTVHRTLKAVA